VKIQAQVEALEKLAALDAELKELTSQLSSERDGLERKRQNLAELDVKLERDRQSLEEMDRLRNDLVVELRQMSIQIDKSREKLSRCRTEREANAAQREVEELRKLYRDREVEVEKLNGLADSARQDIEKTNGEREALAGELGQSEGESASRLGDAESAVKEKEATRKQLVAQVPPALFRRYELVRKRRGTAVAYTDEGTCSECHMLLPPMLYQQLRRREEFGQCPSCNRILYFRVDGDAEAAQTAEDQP
jgi:predicted  nucleic acid-binding Zn-ribbon protein